MSVILSTDKERVHLYVSPSLKETLEIVQKEIALKIKEEFGLTTVTVNGTIASDFIAAHYAKKGNLSFKIRKTALNEGILELV